VTRLLELVSEYLGVVRWVDEDLAGPSDARLVRTLCEVVESKGSHAGREALHAGAAEPTQAAAVAATLGEAAERYALLQYPAELPLATADELPGAAEPERFTPFHRRQLRTPGFPFRRFDRTSRVRWVEATMISSGERVFVPAQLVWLQAEPPPNETPIGFATSSGTASAETRAEATLRATLELIERDAFMITWSNRLSLDRLSWANDPDAAAYAAERFDPTGLTYAAVDLSAFLGVPSVLGVVRGPRGEAPLGIGAASASTARRAWRKALGEAFSVRTSASLFVSSCASARPDFGPDYESVRTFEDHVHLYAFDDTIGRCAFLDSSDRVRSLTTVESLPGVTAVEQLAALAEHLRRRRIDVFVVDITPLDLRELGICVMRAVSPDLCPLDVVHRVRFLGPARLRTAPVESGMRAHPRSFAELNPDPHPFP
jgi:ribosomal protein S12 methylthiotransferase accessory factor